MSTRMEVLVDGQWQGVSLEPGSFEFDAVPLGEAMDLPTRRSWTMSTRLVPPPPPKWLRHPYPGARA